MKYEIKNEMADVLAVVEAADRGEAELKAFEIFGFLDDLYVDALKPVLPDEPGVFASSPVPGSASSRVSSRPDPVNVHEMKASIDF